MTLSDQQREDIFAALDTAISYDEAVCDRLANTDWDMTFTKERLTRWKELQAELDY